MAAAAQWVALPSARAEGVAQAVTAWATPDAWSAAGNPAAMTAVSAPTLTASVVQHALIGALSRPGAAVVIPWGERQRFGAAVSAMGFADYREALAALAYAYRLGRLSLGTRVGLLSLSVPEQGARAIPQVDVGALVALGRQRTLHLGLRTANAHGERVGAEAPQPLPRLVAVGLGWAASSQLTLLVEHQQSELSATQHLGLDYRPTAAVSIRAGAVPSRGQWHFGFGWRHRGLAIDLASRVDPVLGVSPAVGLAYTWERSSP